MISYLREQPRTQALADALRGTSATGGGTQMQPRHGGVASVGSPAPMPNYNQFGGGKEGGGAADFGKLMKKGWDTYGDDIMGMFGGGATGADIGAAASQYGPEVAKMGGNLAGSGGIMPATGSIMGAITAGLTADNLLNESGKEAWHSAGNLNKLGTFNIGGKDIGLRAGDFANGVNPATWLSDPKKGATGLLNAFTFGLFD